MPESNLVTISSEEYEFILDRLYYLRRILKDLSEDIPEINSMRKIVEDMGCVLTYGGEN